ncbi:MAG TPA: hypothetical protein GX723_09810 [Thermoanaerobacterales bacterium]|nr:hypothetical protein [Thermoanaerobacterales bacterium]
MKKVIGKKLYDTETATLIAEYWNVLGKGDFNYLSDDLYVTPNGNYFLSGEGGALTKYGVNCGNSLTGSSNIFSLTREEAYGWLERHKKTKVIIEHFSDLIEEA